MFYISQIQNKLIWDAYGNSLGKCEDVLTGYVKSDFPPIVAIAMKSKDAEDAVLISCASISSFFPSIVINTPAHKMQHYSPKGNELWLIKQVLDHQIVDVEGRRVVRVNDIQIALMQDKYVVTGVDIGGGGLLRRLGLEPLGKKITELLKRPAYQGIIAWKDVAYLAQKDPLQLNMTHEKISKLRPADIAAILNDLDRNTSQSLLEKMDDEVLADTLEESPVKTQVEIISHLDSERAADILEEMEPDEAADLLAEVPAETSKELLGLMEKEDAKDIRNLLKYPEDSAGGIMTTDFAWIPDNLNVANSLEYLRNSKDAQEISDMYYVYILDTSKKLMGEASLRDLVMANPKTEVRTLMNPEPVFVHPLTPQADVAYLIAKYDLLAVPVIDEQSQIMLGIVTLDDAIDTVLPTAYKKRLPRFF